MFTNICYIETDVFLVVVFAVCNPHVKVDILIDSIFSIICHSDNDRLSKGEGGYLKFLDICHVDEVASGTTVN